MKINLSLQTTFSLEEGSDVFTSLEGETKDIVDFEVLTFKQILDASFAEIKDEDERLELIGKIKSSMVEFMKELLDVEENLRSAKTSVAGQSA